jgi:DNA-binding protein H-NS
MTDLSNLSSKELADVIANAQKALAEKQRTERKAVLTQIQALAASIGVTVTIQQERGEAKANSRKGSKVAIKYRNPNDVSQTWTGRGVTPRWLKALVDSGRSISEFQV